MKLALLLSLRGNPILYQGEELGLEQDEIPFERLRDPEAIANWPLTLSRDGARTPFPWTDHPLAGFTTGEPWLPVGAGNRGRAAGLQQGDPHSTLATARSLLALRKAAPELRYGGFELLHATGELLVFRRSLGERQILCAFNFGSADAAIEYWAADCPALISVNGATGRVLPALSAWIGEEASRTGPSG